MAISFGGASYTWQSAQIIGLFCCAGALSLLLTLQQATLTLTTSQDQLVPCELLSQSVEIWILILQNACSTSILFVGLNYVPVYLQFARSETAISAAVKLLPLIITAVVFMLITGALMGRCGYYVSWFVGGSALAVVGTALMRSVSLTDPDAYMIGYSVVLAAGVSLYVQASAPVAQSKLPPSQAANIVSVIGCTQLGSISLALAISNSIFVNRAADRIATILPNVQRTTVQAAIAGIGAPIFRDLPPEKKVKVLTAVADATSDVWTNAMAAAAFSLVTALLLKWEKIPSQA